MPRFALAAAGLLGAICAGVAVRAEETAEPILRIETGMHASVINRLAVAEEGGEFITVSDDKTARRWSLKDGGPRGVWRTPIGGGDQGALFAVAAANDIVVVGGRTGNADGHAAALYVLDRRSGRMLGTIGGFGEAITALAFSRDGHYLAVGEQGQGGLTVIDFVERKRAGRDTNYGGTVAWIAFAPDGRLATSAGDGTLRLYDAAFTLAASTALPAEGISGDRPWGLAFSPDGSRLAVGSLLRAKLRLYSTTNHLALEATLDGAPGRAGALSVPAWSADGRLLAAAGSYKDASDHRLVRFWADEGGEFRSIKDVPVARDTVTDLALLAAGRALYTSAEPSLGIIDRDGHSIVTREAAKADFRDAWQEGFRVSDDGATVEVPVQQDGKRRFRFDLTKGQLTPDPEPRGELHRPVLDQERLKLADWRNGTAPKLNGRAIALEPGEHARSIAILPGGQMAAIGTDFYLRLVRAEAGATRNLRLDQTGDEAWRAILPAPAWGVNASGDGRYVLAALGDGTIRWYGTRYGREVMSLFVDPRDSRWVVWLPEGFFDHGGEPGKPGGETLIGYHLGNGAGKLADFVEIGQLYGLFYRRDLVLAKFRGGPDGAALVAQQLARIGDVRAVLKQGLPPRIALLKACLRPSGGGACPATAPVDPAERHIRVSGSGGELFLRYRIEDRGGGLGRVVLRRNGAVIEGSRSIEAADAKQRTETVSLALEARANDIRLATESAQATIRAGRDEELVIETDAAAPRTDIAVAAAAGVRLFLVAVGVSAYRETEFRLANAANDARAVAELLRQPSPPVYDAAKATVLLDQDATAEHVLDALRLVAAEARPQDLVVIFLSGHGEAVDGKYFFAPVDFGMHHPELLAQAKSADEHRQAEIIDELFRAEGLGEAQLLPAFENIQGNLLLVLDTCYSASLATKDAIELKARNDTIANSVGHETGRFILAGARSLALDSGGEANGADAAAHGLFTTYLLRGLEGEADLQHDGRINVAELLMFTKSRVREASHKLNLDQEPFFYFSGSSFFEIRAIRPAR